MRREKTKRLTEKESEIMERLWAEGPLTIRRLLEGYDEPKPHFNTVATIVRILIQKGYVAHVGESNGAFTYGAIVDASEFGGRSLAQVVKNYFNNSYRSAVSSLVEDEKISVDELREIIELIERKNKQ